METQTDNKPPLPDDPVSRKPLRNATLGFTAIWIIIITCVITNIFILKNAWFMCTTIPIVILVAAAMIQVKIARQMDDGNG